MSTIDFWEVSPNVWKAVHRNELCNMLMITMKTDGEKIVDFSCNCLSEEQPCSHFFVIKEAFRQHLILAELARKTDEKATHNADYYTQMLRETLNGCHVDYENIMRDNYVKTIDVYVMIKLLLKAYSCLVQNNFDEALLISRVCIEEYSSWLELQEEHIVRRMDSEYLAMPFDILRYVLFMQEGRYEKELFAFCNREILKVNNRDTFMYDLLSCLMEELAPKVGSDALVAD
ncbi:MAG: hypothetical protein FWG84_08660 [Bacteroidales bacterium]|nr:hypothetical protein [Bacteroidales bacterium]